MYLNLASKNLTKQTCTWNACRLESATTWGRRLRKQPVSRTYLPRSCIGRRDLQPPLQVDQRPVKAYYSNGPRAIVC